MLILTGHTLGKAIWCLSFSPDGQRLLSCSIDQTARLWDLAAGTHRIVREPHPYLALFATALSTDGQAMACQTSSHVALVSLDDGKEIWKTDMSMSKARVLRSAVHFSPDGRLIAVGGDMVCLFDARTGA